MRIGKIPRRTSPVDRCVILSLLIFCIPFSVTAATYYIDYASGNDTAAGTGITSAWKHCPGDPNAESIPAGIVLRPADTIRFKGGVNYYGSIKCRNNGSADNPIIYDGNFTGTWGAGPAVIDGTEPVTGWKACTRPTDAQGSTNWAKIYYADIDESLDVNSLLILEDGDPLSVSQTPEPLDRFFWDNTANYFTIPATSITTTSLVDTIRLPVQPDGFWQHAYVAVWHQPNLVSLRRIRHYDSQGARLSYDSVGTPYTDRPSRYAIVNSIVHISAPGQFAVTVRTDVPSGSRLFVWPRDSASPGSGRIRISKREFGLDINGRSHITVRGFRVVGQSGNGLRSGIGLGTFTVGMSVTNIVIHGNTVRYTRSGHGKGYGGINLDRGVDCLIASNTVHEVQRHIGIFIVGGSGCRVLENSVNRPGYVGIWAMGASGLSIARNRVSGCLGTHANGISVYSNCRDVNIVANTITTSDLPLTLETSHNLHVVNNLIVGSPQSTKLLAVWAGCTGTLRILNNVFVGSSNHSSVYWSSDTRAQIEMRNNILDGGGGGLRSNNIYVGLLWNQYARYGWALAEGEMVVTDLSTIFRAPQQGDYRLRPGSPAINAGAITPDVTDDLAGRRRPQGSGWDIGAFEHEPYPTHVQSMQ